MKFRCGALGAPGVAVVLSACGAAAGQTVCGGAGPDLMIADVVGVANYAAADGIEAYSTGMVHTNIGDSVLMYQAATAQHPAIAQNLFRLRDVDGAGRFEQIGMSWLFHGFLALSQGGVCPTCQPTDGTRLGIGCSSPDSAGATGNQASLRARWQVNAATGQFVFPGANPSFSGSVARRLQASIADVDPGQNPGAVYFVEVQAVSPDDAAAANSGNNTSYRRCSMTPGGATMSLTGTTVRERAAIYAWQAADPDVRIVSISTPGDGEYLIGSRVTELAGGVRRYEYAVQNLTSDRSAGSIAIALPCGSALSNIGFHDVAYHSGDGPGSVNFSGEDWRATRAGGEIRWETELFVVNPSANALRWGTLYNFRFDTARAPAIGDVTLGLFKPGSPGSVVASGLDVPNPCIGDFDGDGFVTGVDFDAFVAAFEAGDGAADATGDGFVNGEDFDRFVTKFEAGC